VINRFWDYPRWLRAYASRFDLFHIVDHTYAHLALELPADRVVVTVHDVDAFLPLVDPERTQSVLPASLAAKVLNGLRRAARVICVSESTRRDLVAYGLVDANNITVIHNGVDPVYCPGADDAADARVTALLGAPGPDTVDLVHVGTTIPRKRIDTLLQIVAALHHRDARVRLLKVGGSLTEEQQAMAKALGIDNAILRLPFLQARELAAVYRRARAALITSDREGFCLPLIEALACGTHVVASDIPVLREVGADACDYAPVADVNRWTEIVATRLLEDAHSDDAKRQRVARAAAFSWDAHAHAVAAVYKQVGDARSTDRAVLALAQ
jgi:glycosyltransferase involved in cell wall biosynthesis